MLIRQEKNLNRETPLRKELADRGWENFTFYSIEPLSDKTDKTFSLFAFEGAIRKLGITTGFAVFEITIHDMMGHEDDYYVQVA